MSFEVAGDKIPGDEVDKQGEGETMSETMTKADNDFVKGISAEWVGKDDRIQVVHRLCHRTNEELFKSVKIDSAVHVFPVSSKVPKQNPTKKIGGLEHSPFFWFTEESIDWQDQNGFATINDQKKPPLLPENTSMGPNVISNFTFDDYYPRVNLFQGSVNHVQNMLAAFFEYRHEHETDIFNQIVGAMKPEEEASLPEEYMQTLKIFECVQKQMEQQKRTLQHFGLKLVSFCQTWDEEAKKPNFSVPSPHFQTRVIVVDDEILKQCLSTNQSSNVQSLTDGYVKNAIELKQAFIKGDYEGKFVNLDDLWTKIQNIDDFTFERSPLPCATPLHETGGHAFFLHAAPCDCTLNLLKYAHSAAKYARVPFTVFIAADWKTFIKHKNVEELPSNFRAPTKTRLQIPEDKKETTFEKVTEMQTEVVKSLKAIFDYLNKEKIDVLYTSIGRKDRPINMTGGKLTDVKTNTEVHMGSNAVLRLLMSDPFGQIFLRVFEIDGISMVKAMNNVLNKHGNIQVEPLTVETLVNKYAVTRTDDADMGKSFMADVLSVAFAVAHAISSDGFFTKGLALTDEAIKEENEDLKANKATKFDEIIFNGHYVASVDKTGLIEMVKTLLVAEKINVFEHATVWEDPGLNDADDFVATALIKKFSKTCYTDKFDWVNFKNNKCKFTF